MNSPKIAPTEGLDVLEFEVIEWCPNTEGKDATQVWLLERTTQLELPVVVRFKGPGALRELIAALVRHGNNVFGDNGFSNPTDRARAIGVVLGVLDALRGLTIADGLAPKDVVAEMTKRVAAVGEREFGDDWARHVITRRETS